MSAPKPGDVVTFRGDQLREVAELVDQLDGATPLPDSVNAQTGRATWHLTQGRCDDWRTALRDIVATFNVDLDLAHIQDVHTFQVLEGSGVQIYLPKYNDALRRLATRPLPIIDIRAVARGEE